MISALSGDYGAETDARWLARFAQRTIGVLSPFIVTFVTVNDGTLTEPLVGALKFVLWVMMFWASVSASVRSRDQARDNLVTATLKKYRNGMTARGAFARGCVRLVLVVTFLSIGVYRIFLWMMNPDVGIVWGIAPACAFLTIFSGILNVSFTTDRWVDASRRAWRRS